MDHESAGEASPSPTTYEVLVDDNFHYMDESERYASGVFHTYDQALKHARRIVDRSLLDLMEPGKSADDLIASYVMFGEDPWIRPTPEGTERFSAREYARDRAPDIVSGRGRG